MKDSNTIEAFCMNCGHSIEAPVEYIGNTIACPKCGRPVRLSGTTNPSAQRKPVLGDAPAQSASISGTQKLKNLIAARTNSVAQPTSVSDAYLLPVLFICIEIAFGALVGSGVLSPTNILVVIGLFAVPLLTFILILGHLGAIAMRLKAIEEILRNRH